MNSRPTDPARQDAQVRNSLLSRVGWWIGFGVVLRAAQRLVFSNAWIPDASVFMLLGILGFSAITAAWRWWVDLRAAHSREMCWFSRAHRTRPRVLPWIPFLLATLIGWSLSLPWNRAQHQWAVGSSSKVVWSGVITDTSTGVEFRVQKGEGAPFSVRLVLPTALSTKIIRHGDRVVVAGTFRPPKKPRSPGGFDPTRWMIQKGWIGQMDVHTLRVRSGGQMESGIGTLGVGDSGIDMSQAKSWVSHRIHRLFPDSTVASVVSAMTIGDRSALSEELERAFRLSGLTHLLAISGLHFGCIVLLIWLLAGTVIHRLPGSPHVRSASISLLVLLVGWAFANLVGWTPSVQRAFIMLCVSLACRVSGRTGWVARSLLIAGLLITAFQPRQWLSVGTQLSFSAVAGISVALQALRSTNKQLPSWMGAVFVSSAAFVATAPVLLFHIGWVPLIGLLISPLAVALTSVSLTAAVVALLMPVGGHGLAALASLGIDSVIALAHWGADVSAPILVARDGWDLSAVTAMVIVFTVLTAPERYGSLTRFPRLLSIVLLSGFAVFTMLRPGPLSVTFLDVGQGDAIIVQAPGALPLIIDTGPGARAGRALIDALQSRAHFSANLLVTHDDRDHTGGWAALMDGLDIRTTWIAWEASGQQARYSGIHTLGMGDRIDLPSHLRAWVLHPARPGSDNADSMVIFLVHGRVGFLLTGDIDAEAERAIVDRFEPLFRSVDTIVLKAAHHGSNTSTSQVLIDTLDPELAIISAGQDNAFGHPHQEILDRLNHADVRIAGTARLGSLRVQTDGSTSRLQRFENGRWRAIPD